MNRRQFVQTTAGAAAFLAARRSAFAFYQTTSNKISLFGTTLRGVGPGGIPVAAPDAAPAPVTGVTHYTIDVNQFVDNIGGGGPTTFWGYNPAIPLGGGVQPQKHLGGIIVAKKGTPIQLTFRNNLPAKHILPVDVSAFFADAAFIQNKLATHLHGGLVPWISDGGPYDWFSPSGPTGPSFLNNQVLNPGAAPNSAEYFYPNDQSARLVWYHDHAHDTTRLNAYGGVASAYIIRDDAEANLVATAGLPEFIETSVLAGRPIREIPIVVQDKIFVDTATIALDPTWVSNGLSTATGSLWYPHTYEKNRWKTANGINPLPDPSVIPEMFGDTILVNGTTFPKVTVEARRYRIRLLNACNARFLNLQLFVANPADPNGITLNLKSGLPTNTAFNNAAAGGTPNFLVIGNEAGFLQTAQLVPSNLPFNPATFGGSLLAAPAERYDLIVDFTGYAGQSIILYSDGPAPFPVGDPRNDYFPGWNVNGNPVNGLTSPGFGPNTRVLMRFDVVAATGAPDPPLLIHAGTTMPGVDPFLVPPNSSVTGGVFTPPTTTTGGPVSLTRPLTLNETFDNWGRLLQLMGTNVAIAKGTFGRFYLDPVTETPNAGNVEMWQFANLTGDTHPIHFHLVNVQVLARQPFQVKSYAGVPNFQGPARGPDPDEIGWKETVRMNPGEVTTVLMKFDLPKVPFNVPASPRTGNNEYVYHCHILEHEEHDMMRPLVVGGVNPTGLLVWPVSIAGATGGSAIAGSGASSGAVFGAFPAGITAALTPLPSGFNAVTVTVAPLTAVGVHFFTLTDGATAQTVTVNVT
jgi:spore coat protein A